MTIGNWITIIIFGFGVMMAGLGAYYALQGRVAKIENRCETHQAVLDSIATLNQRLDKVMNDNEVFWKVIGPHLENIIHSPKSVDRDALVTKLNAGTITKDDLPVLIELLHQGISNPEWNSEKRFAGILLLARATALFNDAQYERRRSA